MKDEAAAAIVGAVMIAAGLAVWSLAAGLVCGGLELVGGAYIAAYLKARRPVSR